MAERLNRFLGDTPGRTALKLVVISFIVGVIMSAFHWYPIDLVYAVYDTLVGIWHMGFAALGRFGSYLALGAAVVIPVFIILRLLSLRR
jgi:hypothetical protein